MGNFFNYIPDETRIYGNELDVSAYDVCCFLYPKAHIECCDFIYYSPNEKFDLIVDDTPSCSLAEALTKQDLFINSSLADLGASLLWQLFREGMTENRGFFHNIKEFRTQPLKVA